ncbi:hypothetical protein CANMA_004493 [Candida margitis]|uniref:uncharacterized protein n=1 Tax=Candida margitis TaxID=1775924 RepID=UPI002227838E|nr:uncharacterized protein CANMA_004493 [Candida margitis]KAI5956656.1 hypothetical protein CANMA_004493 [Candida margitis]
MWKRLGFGDTTVTNEPTIDYNKTSSSFPSTPTPHRSTRNQKSRLSDDLSTPYRDQPEYDSDEDEELNRYRFDYTRSLDFGNYDLDDDLRRDTEMIREWTRESSLRNKYSYLERKKHEDTHYSLPRRFPGKYQISSKHDVEESKNSKVDLVQQNQIDCEINKLKQELQQEQQTEDDLMPGGSLIPHIANLTTNVQGQTDYLFHLKQHIELSDENNVNNRNDDYQTLKQEYLKELAKMEKLYTCYYNLLEKYVNKKV